MESEDPVDLFDRNETGWYVADDNWTKINAIVLDYEPYGFHENKNEPNFAESIEYGRQAAEVIARGINNLATLKKLPQTREDLIRLFFENAESSLMLNREVRLMLKIELDKLYDRALEIRNLHQSESLEKLLLPKHLYLPSEDKSELLEIFKAQKHKISMEKTPWLISFSVSDPELVEMLHNPWGYLERKKLNKQSDRRVYGFCGVMQVKMSDNTHQTIPYYLYDSTGDKTQMESTQIHEIQHVINNALQAEHTFKPAVDEILARLSSHNSIEDIVYTMNSESKNNSYRYGHSDDMWEQQKKFVEGVCKSIEGYEPISQSEVQILTQHVPERWPGVLRLLRWGNIAQN